MNDMKTPKTRGNFDWRKIYNGNIFQFSSRMWYASEITFVLSTGDSDIEQKLLF